MNAFRMIQSIAKRIGSVSEQLLQTTRKLHAKRVQKKRAIERLTEIKRIKRVRVKFESSHSHCSNCGEELKGMYCHCCGQYATEANESLPRFIKHYLDTNFSYDGRLWITLKYLLIRPGFLPHEYTKGRITSYMHPFKLYMFTSFVFFFLFFSFTLDKELVTELNSNTNNLTINLNDTNAQTTGKTTRIKDLSEFFEVASGHFKTYSPMAMFFLMPVFALILMLIYRQKRYPYVHHLIFSINIYTVLLILFSIAIITDYIFAKTAPDINTYVSNILLAGTIIYFIAASKTFYMLSWKKIILKTGFVISAYTFLVFILFIAFLVIEIIHTYQLT